MDRPFYSPLTPSGLIRLTTRLPERLVGELDVAIGHQRVSGNWLNRSAAINETVIAFFAAETLQTVDTALVDAAIAGRRRSISMHLERESLIRMRIEISDAHDAGTYWGEWEVVAVSIRRFLDLDVFAVSEM